MAGRCVSLCTASQPHPRGAGGRISFPRPSRAPFVYECLCSHVRCLLLVCQSLCTAAMLSGVTVDLCALCPGPLGHLLTSVPLMLIPLQPGGPLPLSCARLRADTNFHLGCPSRDVLVAPSPPGLGSAVWACLTLCPVTAPSLPPSSPTPEVWLGLLPAARLAWWGCVPQAASLAVGLCWVLNPGLPACQARALH